MPSRPGIPVEQDEVGLLGGDAGQSLAAISGLDQLVIVLQQLHEKISVHSKSSTIRIFFTVSPLMVRGEVKCNSTKNRRPQPGRDPVGADRSQWGI